MDCCPGVVARGRVGAGASAERGGADEGGGERGEDAGSATTVRLNSRHLTAASVQRNPEPLGVPVWAQLAIMTRPSA